MGLTGSSGHPGASPTVTAESASLGDLRSYMGGAAGGMQPGGGGLTSGLGGHGGHASQHPLAGSTSRNSLHSNNDLLGSGAGVLNQVPIGVRRGVSK
jgi:hypothetical protein